MEEMTMKTIILFTLIPFMAIAGILPDKDEAVAREVAVEYSLNRIETNLLLVIRRIENGRAGLEFGVGDGMEDHPARRYAGDYDRSFKLQAQWAAGTIEKRFTGDLEAFSKRYCPVNWKVWLKNATFYMKKLEEQP
jgi:hypothetical protein